MSVQAPLTPADLEPAPAPAPPAWEAPYATWQAAPTPENLYGVVKTLKPTLGYAVSSVGGHGNPILASRALVHAARAVKTYTPGMGASLPTYVSSQLRSLTRDARQVGSVARVPERAQLDTVRLNRAVQEFIEERGREPDTLELADYTGMPVKRIEKVRKYTDRRVVSEEAALDMADSSPDYDKEAVEYAMHGADHVDRRILEMKTGYGGHPILTPQAIALKLKLTPSQLSRRSQRLTYQINQISQALGRI